MQKRSSKDGPSRINGGVAFCVLLVAVGCDTSRTTVDPDPEPSSDAGVEAPDASPDAALDASPDAAVLVDAAPASACRPGRPTDDAGVPCPQEFVVQCPEGSFELPGGRCTQVWVCPPGWVRMPGGPGCEPPPMRADCPDGSFAVPHGACSEPWICPPGWRRIAGAVGCEAAYGACGDDALARPGGVCESLGLDVCREAALPGAGIVHVDAASPEGGDGSVARPFRALGEALAAAGEAATIDVAPGRYAEDVLIERSVRLEGRCAGQVELAGVVRVAGGRSMLSGLRVGRVEVEGGVLEVVSVDVPGGLFAGGAGQIVAARVRIADAPAAGVRAEAGGRVTCADCLVVRAAGLGAVASGAGSEVEIRGSVLAGTRPVDAGAVAGVRAEAGGAVRVEDSLLADHVGSGVGVHGEASAATLARVVIRGTRPRRARTSTGAIELLGGTLDLTDAELTDNGDRGVDLAAGARGTALRVAVRGGRETPDATGNARGFSVRSGTQLDASHAMVLDHDQFGVLVDAGGRATLRDVSVRVIHELSNGNNGTGIGVIAGEADLARVEIDTIEGYGYDANAATLLGRQIVVRDVVQAQGVFFGGGHVANGGVTDVEDIRFERAQLIVLTEANLKAARCSVGGAVDPGMAAGVRGGAIQVNGGSATLRDCAVEGASVVALGVSLGRVDVERLTARGIRAGVDGGAGAVNLFGGSGRIVDLALQDIEGVGLLAHRIDSHFDLRRVSMRSVRLPSRSDAPGRALEVGFGAQLTLAEARLEDVSHVGVLAIRDSVSLVASDLSIVGVRASTPPPGRSPFRETSAGVTVSEGARFTAERLEVRDAESLGVLVARGGTLELADARVLGTVEGSAGGRGDGLFVDGSEVVATGLLLGGNARAGVALSSGQVVLRRSRVTGNGVGVIQQLESRLSLEDGSVIEANRGEDRVCLQACTERPEPLAATDPLPEDGAGP